jgi:nuclear pore complex protein Nup54
MQIAIVKDKWDPPSQSSPFRAYLYNNVGEEAAPFYQPGPEDDHTKWEEALRKRPGPGYVPVLVKGFWELGKRAQRQRDFLTMMQSRLHEINNCLTELLSKHDLNLSIKIADARRKHIILSKRCLALAAKTQILRNRGYAMDEAEEELKKKLTQLERSVFDPSINGRGEEIWARMLAIHEHSKRLQAELDRAGVSVTPAEDDIDEQTLKTAKKVRYLICMLLEPPTDYLRFSMTTTPRFSISRRKWSLSRRTLKKRRARTETDYFLSAQLPFNSQVHLFLFILTVMGVLAF